MKRKYYPTVWAGLMLLALTLVAALAGAGQARAEPLHLNAQVRLADAVCRLSLGVPVARIATDLGYRSPSAFSAMFHRALGAPPQRYLQDADALNRR